MAFNTLLILLQSLTAASTLVLALIISRSSKETYSRQFVIVCLSIFMWSLGTLIMLFSRESTLSNIGANVFYIAPTVIPIALFGYAIMFPTSKL